ncbi:hypothetical protein EDC39_101244 [Geothermobacter ehrlichii]|uniref:Uncharacterized protein n=1 Tax=Geothermobacter ehrlichii TaxID=213224 RepID=A0A5D3WP18_9BACT|nr:hypothetical protein [Geothermobacter ehrlichii]TYP00084.1 hypothetical protein EDC39_101244 [Geothermobacter ehrlichii]
MAGQYYDLIVIGDAPAGRIAAAILARDGMRILHLNGFGWPSSLLWSSSILLEHLLEQIGGRTCLAPPLPIHFRQDDACLLLHGEAPLRDELQREYPRQAAEILDLLDRLNGLGGQVQAVLLQEKFSPAGGWSDRLRWPFLAIKHGLSPRLHRQLLTDWLQAARASATATRVISGLLSTATLEPADTITVIEAALAVAQLRNEHGVAPAVLDSLLSRRLNEAGVPHRDAFTLTALKQVAGRWSCRFGEEEIQAGLVALAGQPGWPIEGLDAATLQKPRSGLWRLDRFVGRVAAVHASRILFASDIGPLQIAIGSRKGRPDIWLRTACGLSETPELKARLDRLFPFTDYLPLLIETPHPPAAAAGFCGRLGNPGLGRRNLHLASGALLYPKLGLAGEALTALELLAVAGRKRRR